MSRFTFGPQVTDVKAHRNPAGPPAPVAVVSAAAAPAKTDVAITYLSYDAFGNVTYNLPAYDLTTGNKLLGVHTVFVVSGSTLYTDGASAMASGLPLGSLDTSAIQSGQNVTVPAPTTLPDAVVDYVIQTVLEFDV